MPDHWPQVDLEKIKGLRSFVEVAKEICFKNLKGIVTAELEPLTYRS